MKNLRNRIDARLLSNKKNTIYNAHKNQATCYKKYLTMI